jgi:hypothetical protein
MTERLVRVTYGTTTEQLIISANFEKLIKTLQYEMQIPADAELKYIDDDGDPVTFSSTAELQEAFSNTEQLEIQVSCPGQDSKLTLLVTVNFRGSLAKLGEWKTSIPPQWTAGTLVSHIQNSKNLPQPIILISNGIKLEATQPLSQEANLTFVAFPLTESLNDFYHQRMKRSFANSDLWVQCFSPEISNPADITQIRNFHQQYLTDNPEATFHVREFEVEKETERSALVRLAWTTKVHDDYKALAYRELHRLERIQVNGPWRIFCFEYLGEYIEPDLRQSDVKELQELPASSASDVRQDSIAAQTTSPEIDIQPDADEELAKLSAIATDAKQYGISIIVAPTNQPVQESDDDCLDPPKESKSSVVCADQKAVDSGLIQPPADSKATVSSECVERKAGDSPPPTGSTVTVSSVCVEKENGDSGLIEPSVGSKAPVSSACVFIPVDSTATVSTACVEKTAGDSELIQSPSDSKVTGVQQKGGDSGGFLDALVEALRTPKSCNGLANALTAVFRRMPASTKSAAHRASVTIISHMITHPLLNCLLQHMIAVFPTILLESSSLCFESLSAELEAVRGLLPSILASSTLADFLSYSWRAQLPFKSLQDEVIAVLRSLFHFVYWTTMRSLADRGKLPHLRVPRCCSCASPSVIYKCLVCSESQAFLCEACENEHTEWHPLLKQRAAVGMLTSLDDVSEQHVNQNLNLFLTNPQLALMQLQAQQAQSIVSAFKPGQPFFTCEPAIETTQVHNADPPGSHVVQNVFRAANTLLSPDCKASRIPFETKAIESIMLAVDSHDMEHLGDDGELGDISNTSKIPNSSDSSDSDEEIKRKLAPEEAPALEAAPVVHKPQAAREEANRIKAEQETTRCNQRQVTDCREKATIGLEADRLFCLTKETEAATRIEAERLAKEEAQEAARLLALAERKQRQDAEREIAESKRIQDAERRERENQHNQVEMTIPQGEFADQRANLLSMGFADDASNLTQLRRFDGDLRAVLDRLLPGG